MSIAKISSQLRRMEEALADPKVRAAEGVMQSMLHPDFMEIGASGRVFSRATIIDLLGTETDFTPYEITDFSVTPLGVDQALVTYKIPARSVDGALKSASLRSSLWIKEDGIWLLRFHQGTYCT